MANVEMSPNPKKVSSFIINGKRYEGTSAEYYEGKLKGEEVKNDLAGTGDADRVAKKTKE